MKNDTERKKTRRLKQQKFQEDLRMRKSGGRSKICKATKGKHVYDVLVKVTYSSWHQYYTLICACGKRTWKVPWIYPLSKLPKYTVCKKHGYLNDGKPCWACEMKFESWEKI